MALITNSTSSMRGYAIADPVNLNINPCREIVMDNRGITLDTITAGKVCGIYEDHAGRIKKDIKHLIEEGLVSEIDGEFFTAYIVTDEKAMSYISGTGYKEVKPGLTFVLSGQIIVMPYKAAIRHGKSNGFNAISMFPAAVKDVYKDPKFKVFEVKVPKSKIKEICADHIYVQEFEVIKEIPLAAEISFKVTSVYLDRNISGYIVCVQLVNETTGLTALLDVVFDTLEFSGDELSDAVEKKIDEAFAMCRVLEMRGNL